MKTAAWANCVTLVGLRELSEAWFPKCKARMMHGLESIMKTSEKKKPEVYDRHIEDYWEMKYLLGRGRLFMLKWINQTINKMCAPRWLEILTLSFPT